METPSSLESFLPLFSQAPFLSMTMGRELGQMNHRGWLGLTYFLTPGTEKMKDGKDCLI